MNGSEFSLSFTLYFTPIQDIDDPAFGDLVILGRASPRLKDASIPPSLLPPLYIEVVQILRILFHRCRLVHADFSEYNILYHDSHLWIIDVSQSIEQEHPAAFDFLRSDLKNAEEWFSRRGVKTLGVRRTFGFVTRDTWIKGREESDEDVKVEIERLLDQLEDEGEEEQEEPSKLEETQRDREDAQRELEGATNPSSSTKTRTRTKRDESDEAVFAQSYIPRALDDVYDPERDVQRVLRGEGGDLIYADITGVAKIHRQEEEDDQKRGGINDDDDEEEGEESGSDEESGSESGSEDGKEKRPRGKKHEDKEDKKVTSFSSLHFSHLQLMWVEVECVQKRRAEVKEKNREKRKEKMSKSEKNRRMKKSSGKR